MISLALPLSRLRQTLTLSPLHSHVLRTVFAALLALWVAYQLELDTPYSAAITVLIVAHPVHGMVLSKSLFRLGGTILGALVAVLLMALFNQSSEMFLLGLGIWMGLCTMASTLLRNFRSYGAILAGYTVVLITMPAIDTPELVWNYALSRLAVVSLGIFSSALVASITTGRQAERSLEERLAASLRLVAGYARRSLDGATARELSLSRRKLAGDIAALDAQVEFAAIETAVGMSGLADALRGATMAMLGSLTAAASAHDALERLVDCTAQEPLRLDFLALLARLEQSTSLDDWRGLRQDLALLRERLEAGLESQDMTLLTAIDRMDELADELAMALRGLVDLASGERPVKGRTVHRHRDYRWAAINGLRAFIAVWLAGAIWIHTSWPAGSAMVASIVPNVGLLSMRDRPARDAVSFVWGTSLASLFGFLYLLFVLPQITGFPLLVMVMAPPLLVGVSMTMHPKTAFIGLGFCVFFITLLAPSNPMVYAPELFLNNALATVAGAALTSLVHSMVLPVDPRRHVRALIRAIRSDLHALILGGGANHWRNASAWENRMHERLIQLGARMRAAGVAQDTLLRGGFAALRIGREILRLRALLDHDPQARQACGPVIAALRALSAKPKDALTESRQAAHILLEMAALRPQPEALALVRGAASFTEIAVLLGRYRRFFQLPVGL